jgi:hypothetical protein
MTSGWRKSVVEGVSVQLVQAYFDRAVAERIAAHVRQRLSAGAYETLEDPAEFARLLTAHLREVNADLHPNQDPDPLSDACFRRRFFRP